jgi:hypothetical protein
MTKKQIEMILVALKDHEAVQGECEIWSSEDERVYRQIRSKLLKYYDKNLGRTVK